MENDELRELWKQGQSLYPQTGMNEKDIRKLLEMRIRTAQLRIRKKLLFELSGMLAILFMIGAVLFVQSHLPLISLAITVASFIFIIPNGFLFILLIRRVSSLDYGIDLRARHTAYLRLHQKTIRIYLRSAYGFSVVLALIVLFIPMEAVNENYMMYFKLGFMGFIAVVTVFYRPYVRWMFDKDAQQMAAQLQALENIETTLHN